ncbi:hypothetical protein AGR7A_Lc10030 [Agrobacterium deltaense NCPPB 1641]|uniref:Uncharacterized protein n=1 Tax=Agrobacterium deltaense NCPPB 1641 TaxID=1183425 RepID=A0A1S7TRU5_9HYPH|nr:hypothetical protein AGR7A_Lc10030 [Agrobacterium deltaense NCPPB 1641]
MPSSPGLSDNIRNWHTYLVKHNLIETVASIYCLNRLD